MTLPASGNRLPERKGARRKESEGRLERLAKAPGLSEWERGFVADVSRGGKLSPRQEKVVERLSTEHLEKRGVR
jgi:hypothetical protein